MRIKDRTIDSGLLLKIFLKSLKSSHYYVFKWDRKEKLYSYICKKKKYMTLSIQPKFPEISVQNPMDQFGPAGKVSKKLVHLLRWTTFPGRTGLNFV